MRRLVAQSIIALIALALIGVGAAWAQVDPGYGEGGTVHLRPPLPSGAVSQTPGAIALGPRGEAFVVSRQPGCADCRLGDFLFAYGGDGRLDTTFGGPAGFEIPFEGEPTPLLAVDPAGRPIVARVVGSGRGEAEGGGERVVVRRLLPSGQPDTSFGKEGAVSIPCSCNYVATRLIVGSQGQVFVAVPRSGALIPGTGGHPGFTLIGLDADGHRLHGFGSRGVATQAVPTAEELGYEAVAPGGAIYVGGPTDGSSTLVSYLTRVSVEGRVDTRFARSAEKSLERLYIGGSFGDVTDLVTTRRGEIEAFGTASGSRGFELRLKADGTLDRSFARNGLRLLPYPVFAARRGGEGATMALAGGEAGPQRLLRILADGRLDKRFGAQGELIPAGAGRFGLALEPGGRGAVTVVDHDYTLCRFVCLSDPSLYRFLERP